VCVVLVVVVVVVVVLSWVKAVSEVGAGSAESDAVGFDQLFAFWFARLCSPANEIDYWQSAHPRIESSIQDLLLYNSNSTALQQPSACQPTLSTAFLLSAIYTVNHKKRDILFLTITSANLNRFL